MDDLPRGELKKSGENSNVKASVIATNLHEIYPRNVSPLISRRKRDVAKDMEALILSRQDDPFLQVFISFTYLQSFGNFILFIRHLPAGKIKMKRQK